MTERENLWAPWRIAYIRGLDESGAPVQEKDGCFICRNLRTPDQDDKNLVLWRTDKSLVVLNRFPYNNGHLLLHPPGTYLISLRWTTRKLWS
jgi:ATP adenylyltransferase